MTDRITGIVDKVSGAEKLSTVDFVLKAPVIKNLAQSVVDSKMKANVDFQGKAGLSPKVTRRSIGYCCEWCNNLIGTYEYPAVPKNVYHRHDNCNCLVEYFPGDGRKQNVHTKVWELEDPEELEARKATVGVDVTPMIKPELSKMEEALINRNVAYNPPQELVNQLTDSEIIERVGGVDFTEGSCVSLCHAYMGEKGGLDVLDFRGGESRKVFSNRMNNKSLFESVGATMKVEKRVNDFTACHQLMKSMEEGKTYMLETGKHGAMVRKTKDGFEYLEMQSDTDNGWKTLNDDVLKWRFGCQKSHTTYGTKYERENLLIEADSLYNNSEYQKILGYINTASDSQKKGYGGSVK